jgi:hypothetical protein
MNRHSYLLSFFTGASLDLAGVFTPNIPIDFGNICFNGVLGLLQAIDWKSAFVNLLGIILSGFLAAMGAWLFNSIKKKFSK